MSSWLMAAVCARGDLRPPLNAGVLPRPEGALGPRPNVPLGPDPKVPLEVLRPSGRPEGAGRGAQARLVNSTATSADDPGGPL